MSSSIFSVDGTVANKSIDKTLIRCFALYTCLQSSDKAIHRKAVFIEQESTMDEFMQSNLFQQTIKLVLE